MLSCISFAEWSIKPKCNKIHRPHFGKPLQNFPTKEGKYWNPSTVRIIFTSVITSVWLCNYTIIFRHTIETCELTFYKHLRMRTRPSFEKTRFCKSNVTFWSWNKGSFRQKQSEIKKIKNLQWSLFFTVKWNFSR